MEKILKIGYWIFTCAIVAVALLVAGTLFPIPGNYKVKVVMSGSMEPAIHTGSVVVIKPEKNYTVGEVITFGKDTKKNIPTTHRIAEMRVQDGKYVYRTKGDANKTSDMNEVQESAIIGKVLFSIPFLGFVLDFAKKPLGFALLVILPAVAIIADEVKKIWIEVRKVSRSKNQVSRSTDVESCG